jgi:hypothetical protein
MSAMSDEEAFVRAFIVPEKQERYLTLLSLPKRRADILSRLDHQLDYDRALAARVPDGDQCSSRIAELLVARKAPSTCHAISADSALDGRDLPLHEALCRIVGSGVGSVLSCIPGKLAYYEAEDAGERYIFSR